MSSEQASFEDWVNAITRPVIGLLLGQGLGYVIELAIGGSFWLAVIACIVAAIIWFGVLYLNKLNTKVTNWLFGGAGVRPAANRQTSPRQSWSAKVGRYGLVGGIVLGCLAVFVLPYPLLDLLP